MAPPKKTKFRGNENLKAGFVTETVSPEEFEFRTREIVKCRNDIVYFADHYYTIVAPKLGKHIIKTFPKQHVLNSSRLSLTVFCVAQYVMSLPSIVVPSNIFRRIPSCQLCSDSGGDTTHYQ